MRALLVLLCVFGASLGFAPGSHATSHSLVGAAQPSHHHHSPNGQTSQTGDEVIPTRTRRRIRAGVVRLLPSRVLAYWVRLRRVVLRLDTRVVPVDPWPARGAVASSPARFGICRT